MKFLFISFFLFAAAVFAQTGSLNGSVAAEGSPIGGATVSIQIIQQSVLTNNAGEFYFDAVPAGEYIIRVSHFGYKQFDQTIHIEAGKTTDIAISLAISSYSLGEVVISGSRYETILRESPIPIEVVSAPQIEKSPALTVPEILGREAGINLGRDGIWSTFVNIRGLSRNNVVTLIDGFRIETANDLSAGLALIDLNDIERIEVIKGASSSINGTGALGGSINIITKNASFTENFNTGGSFSSAYNSVNTMGLGHLSLYASDSQWYLRVSGSLRSADDTQTPEGELSNSQFRDNNLAAVLGFAPFENHEIRFTYNRFYAEDVGIPGGSVFTPATVATYPSEQRDLYSFEYKVKNISSHLLSLSVRYFHQLINRNVLVYPNPNVRLTPHADHATNGIQLLSNWNVNGDHHLVFGIDAWQRELDSRRERLMLMMNRISGERPIPVSRYRSVGIFAQQQYAFDAQWRMTLGGRVDFISIKNDSSFNPEYIIDNGVRNNNPPSKKLIWEAGTASNTSWSVNLGLLYALSDKIDFSFNIARSFRAPNLEERFQYIDLGSTVRLGNPELQPEQGYFVDLGARFWLNNFSLRVNAFYNSLQDMVIEIPGTYEGRQAYILENLGSARLYGFDISLDANLYQSLVLFGTASFVRGEDAETDDDLPQIPPFHGSLGLRTPLFNTIQINTTASIFGDQRHITEGESETGGYAVIDAYISSLPLTVSNITFELIGGVENIFDRAYRNHLSSNRGIIRLEPGRNFFLRLSVSW